MANSKISDHLTSLITSATASPTTQVPGLVFQAISRDGEILNSTASGVRSISSTETMTTDTVFWIASCTKIVSAIALMQLVEQGKADLDSANQLEEYVPELKNVKILEKGVLREKKESITLRMLMTHTSGLCYSFFNYDLWENHFKLDPNADELQGTLEGVTQPLVFEPGTNRAYGTGIDWAGIFIERLTEQSLGQYMQTYIFTPLNLTSTSFAPTPNMRSRLAGCHQRSYTPPYTISEREHAYKPAREEIPNLFHSAGGGLFTTAPEYCQILATLLNDGLSPTTGHRILRKETINQMFTNQLSDWMEKYAARGTPVSRPELAQKSLENEVPVMGPQGWGISFLLVGDERLEGMTGKGVQFYRGGGAGLANCFWGMDRERGVAGVLFSQVLPFGDPVVFPLWERLQGVLYGEA